MRFQRAGSMLRQFRTAATAQVASTRPNGHAPYRKPCAHHNAHEAANATMYQRLRFCSEYVTSIDVTANSPKIIK
jgi:hypothetical protein